MSGQIDDVVRIECATSLGIIELELNLVAAPITSRNFLRYVQTRSFDNTSFYRICAPRNQEAVASPISVIHGGLSVDLRRIFPAIEHEPTSKTGLKHLCGTVSMARRAPGSASGSFFICIRDEPELDFGGQRYSDGQGFAAFGMVSKGTSIARAIWERAELETYLKKPIPIYSVSIPGPLSVVG